MSYHRTTVRPLISRGVRSYRARCECGWISGNRYQFTGDAALDGVAHSITGRQADGWPAPARLDWANPYHRHNA